MSHRRSRMVLLLWLCACASEAAAPAAFDSSAGLVVVDVAGDGFVRCEGRRMPLEALVLQLRQRTRAMTGDELARFVVHLRIDPAVNDGVAVQRAQKDMNRMLDELEIMGVSQVVFR